VKKEKKKADRARFSVPFWCSPPARELQITKGPEADIALTPRLMDYRCVAGHSASSASGTKGYSARGGLRRLRNAEEEDAGILQRRQGERTKTMPLAKIADMLLYTAAD